MPGSKYLFALVLAFAPFIWQGAPAADKAATPAIAVGPQYSSAHVYVAPEDFERFVGSFLATFGGSKSAPASLQITPTPSQTTWQAVTTPVGLLSVFAFKTPVPYPFGSERTGYLVTNMDTAVRSAIEQGADLQVAVFPDPIGRDALIEWPGGLRMQLYWHTTPPKAAPLTTIPENHVYVSPGRAKAFIGGFLAFAQGAVTSDEADAPGIEVGQNGVTYRRVRIDSKFGKFAVLVTDGHLPYPYGREIMGYEVANLVETLSKAQTAGVTVLVQPYDAESRRDAMVQFPGGYIAEIHSAARH